MQWIFRRLIFAGFTIISIFDAFIKMITVNKTIMKKILLMAAAVAMLSVSSCQASGASKEAASTETQATRVTSDPVLVLAKGAELPKTDKLMVLDFNAVWCGPCRQFAPAFEKAAEDFAGKAVFVSVNVDSCPEVAVQFGVQGIPHVAFVQPDGTVSSFVGTDQLSNFNALVEQYLK